MEQASSYVDALVNAHSYFVESTSLTPLVSAELEFYIKGDVKPSMLDEIFAMADIESEVKIEDGIGQYEVVFSPTSITTDLAENIEATRFVICQLAQRYDCEALFTPIIDDDIQVPGSALQFHLCALDEFGHNVFAKTPLGKESLILKKAIAGILETMPAGMKYFVPTADGYKRFGRINTPQTFSWGGNNRTVALRLPTSTLVPHARRIEHRVPSANSDPWACLACILAGAAYGIENLSPTDAPKIYGDASDEQYNLPRIVADASYYSSEIHGAFIDIF